MSNEPYDRKALIQYRLERARESLNDARLMLEQNGSPAGVINRAYYAMFYATLALLITIDRGSSKHQGVIALFDENFIKQNILPKELGKILHRAFEMRQVGDYRDLMVVTKEQAMDVFNSAIQFMDTIEEKLSKDG
ncbi:MAG: HEPN domain-containing protein [Chloroflexota bacterium]